MEWFYFFWASMLHDASDQVSAEEHIWVGRSCLKTSKKAVNCMTIFDIWVEWKKHFLVSFGLTYLIKFLLMRTWFGGRCCLTHFKMAIQWMAIFDIWIKLLKQCLVSILPWRLPSILCSKENMGWRLLFEEFQDGCLVHGHLWYLNWRI